MSKKETEEKVADKVVEFVDLRDEVVESAVGYVTLLDRLNFDKDTFEFDNDDLSTKDLLEYRKASRELIEKVEKLIKLREDEEEND